MGFGRTFLYHWEYPDGRIFTDKAEYDEALSDGWVEAPWLVDSGKKQLKYEPRGKPWPKGTSGNPAGRARGAVNKWSLAVNPTLAGK